MVSGIEYKRSTPRRRRARACAGILALCLGASAVGTGAAHASSTSRRANSTSSTDPRYAGLARAAASGQPVTIDELTTADSTTQALPDGTLASTTTVEPTRMKDAAGAWEPISPTLRRNTDGTISTTATPNALRLSGGGTGPAITATDQSGHSIAFTLPVPLPAPTLLGASATYTQIYPGVDLTVTAQPTGAFSEVFELENAAAQAQQPTFSIQLSGLSISQTADGSLQVIDTSTGQTVMSAPPSVMWDSATNAHADANVADDFETVTNANSSAAGPGLRARTGPLPITVAGGTLAFDGAPADLGTTTAAYPLYQAATWTEPFASGGTLNWDEEQSGCPTYTNWDNVPQPGVGYLSSGPGGCFGAYRSFYEINTANLNSADTIVSSMLKMNEVYSALVSCNEGSEAITVRTVGPISPSNSWNTPDGKDNSVAPSPALTVESVGNANGTICNGGTVPANFDVHNEVAAAAAGNWPNLTLGMYGDETAASDTLERFNDNPSIYTIYDIPPNTPTNLTAAPTPVDSNGVADQGCHTGVNTDWMGETNIGGQRIATLSATLTSAVPTAQMFARFEFYDHATNTETFTNSAGYVTSPGTVSVQTPALQDGHLYTWQVNADDQYYPSPIAQYCGFTTDFTPPTNPTVTSTDFPPLSTQSTKAETGQSGTLTLTANDQIPTDNGAASGLRGLYYSFDSPVAIGAQATVWAPAGASGAATDSTSASFETSRWGVHTLYTQSIDNAGNLSAQSQYSFYVPWNPSSAPVPGDINGDGIPDLLTTSGGNLLMYPGGTNPAVTPTTISTATDSPARDNWANYLVTHRGSPSGAATDDLWALDTTPDKSGTKNLYLYKPDTTGAGTYTNTNNIVGPITKSNVRDDSDLKLTPSADPHGYSTTGCVDPANYTATTATSNGCAGYDATDWNNVTQLIAPGDLYTASPNAQTLDTATPGLLTVENGNLWYYQGISRLHYASTAILLGTSTTTDNWNDYTLIAPGTVSAHPALWARNDNTGALYQYLIHYTSNGYPASLGTPQSGSGTALNLPNNQPLPKSAFPQITSPGAFRNPSASDPEPDLLATTANGELIDYLTDTPSTAAVATFTDPPQALGNDTTPITTGTGYILPSNGIDYPTGSTWTTAKTTTTFDSGVLTLTDTATGTILATFGTGAHPNAFLVMQADGNLVIYTDYTNPAPLWASNTAGNPGANLSLQADGNLVLYTPTATALWASNTNH